MTDRAPLTEAEIDAISERILRKLQLRAPTLESYVDAEVIEDHFRVSRATVHNWVHNEGCPHHQRGKILRFKLGDVEDWFAGRQQRRAMVKSVP